LASDKKQLANNPFSAKNRDFGPYFDLSKLALHGPFFNCTSSCCQPAEVPLTQH
jgi:hypothetical protein